jgi:hypothetical protein
MVAATRNPRLWRIEADVAFTETSRSTIVCFAHLTERSGLRIYYSHHSMFGRMVDKGTWQKHLDVRQPLSSHMRSMLQMLVWQEIWQESCLERVDIFPAEIGADPSEVNLGED